MNPRGVTATGGHQKGQGDGVFEKVVSHYIKVRQKLDSVPSEKSRGDRAKKLSEARHDGEATVAKEDTKDDTEGLATPFKSPDEYRRRQNL